MKLPRRFRDAKIRCAVRPQRPTLRSIRILTTGLVMLTVNAVRAILSFSMLSEVELERLALSAAGVHLVRSQ